MNFNMAEIGPFKFSLKKIVEICPFGLFHFSIHRMRIGKKWGRFLIVFADALDEKIWWL